MCARVCACAGVWRAAVVPERGAQSRGPWPAALSRHAWHRRSHARRQSSAGPPPTACLGLRLRGCVRVRGDAGIELGKRAVLEKTLQYLRALFHGQSTCSGACRVYSQTRLLTLTKPPTFVPREPGNVPMCEPSTMNVLEGSDWPCWARSASTSFIFVGTDHAPDPRLPPLRGHFVC